MTYSHVYSHVFVVNYTPHAVTLLRYDGSTRMTLPSRGVARCAEIGKPLPPINWDPFGDSGIVDELDTCMKRFGLVDGLPDPKDNVMYIVSQIVFDALPERVDLLVPSDVVRDSSGQVAGFRSFSRRPMMHLAEREELVRLLDADAEQRGGNGLCASWGVDQLPLDVLRQIASRLTPVA